MNKKELLFKGIDLNKRLVTQSKIITYEKDEYTNTSLDWYVWEIVGDYFILIKIDNDYAYFVTQGEVDLVYRFELDENLRLKTKEENEK